MSADRVSQLKASTQQQQLGVEEQLSLVKFLRHAVQYKDEQIATLQSELATIKSAADAQRESIEIEKQSEIDEAQHKLAMSELERQRLQGEMHSFRTLEPEVGSLRQEVDKLQQTLGRERREHEAQLRRLGDDYQQYRSALQEQFSVMVHSNGLVDLSSKGTDIDESSEGDSEGMVSDAMRAAQAQSEERIEQLGTELLAAQRAGEAAMKRHGELQTAYNKLKLEHDVQAESLREQTRAAVRYKKKLSAVTAKLERFEKQAERMSTRPTSAGTLAGGSSLRDDNDSSPSLSSEVPVRKSSAASTRSASSVGSTGSRGSRVRSAGASSSRSVGQRPVSRAGSELSDYLEKRGLRPRQLQDDSALAHTALSPGVDMAAWAEAAVQGSAPPNVAPPMPGVWSSHPDQKECDDRETEIAQFREDRSSSPVGSLRSEPSLNTLDSNLSSGSNDRRRGMKVGAGPRRSFRHAMLTESRSTSKVSGRFLAP